jgi:hypothetical protein
MMLSGPHPEVKNRSSSYSSEAPVDPILGFCSTMCEVPTVKIHLTLTVVMIGACQMYAADTYIAEAKAAHETIKTNLIKSAEKMPEDGYTFQPTKEERTFAALIGHIADAETRICSVTMGEMKPATAGKLTGKAELVAALKASSDVCDKAFAALTDESASGMVSMGRGPQRSRLGTLIYNNTHDNESYGTVAVYLRLKGIVPPSSEK